MERFFMNCHPVFATLIPLKIEVSDFQQKSS